MCTLFTFCIAPLAFRARRGPEILETVPTSPSSADPAQAPGHSPKHQKHPRTLPKCSKRVTAPLKTPWHQCFAASRRPQVLETVPTSQSSADQRKGRAGREAPGEAYRLYTEPSFSQMSVFTVCSYAWNLASKEYFVFGIVLDQRSRDLFSRPFQRGSSF